MRLTSVIPMLLLLLAACGGEENNAANNAATNNTATNNTATNNTATNNTATNNTATNNTATNNTATNNTATNNNSGGGGTIDVDLALTVDTYAGTMMSCTWADETAKVLALWSPAGGMPNGMIECAVVDPNSVTGAFVFTLQVWEGASGEILADDFAFEENVWVKLAYSNGAVPVVHIANTIQATKTGSVTIDAFDVATGELRGSIDVTLTDMGGITYTAAGTFDASLGLCGDTTLLQCQGKP